MACNPICVLSGRKVAIDASMSIYQFLIAVRSEGAMLTSADGETTRFSFIYFAPLNNIYIEMFSFVQSLDGYFLPDHSDG